MSLLSCSFPRIASAGSGEAANKVRAGIASYQAGDYKQAAEVFSEAESAQPDDLRIAFDRGTALAAQGDDKAVELLQKAALSPDLQLAVRARYNLGCLAAAKAQKRFGEHPEKASPEDRKNGLADLAVAIGHFRDCLRMDKDHADARHNLELLRVWIKYMESLWEQTDRQKQRDEMDLPAYLQMLEEKQRATAASRPGRWPRRATRPNIREAQRAAETAQRKLGEEIGPLKEKIEATLNKAAQPSPGGGRGGSPAPAVSSDELKKAIASLQSMADEAGMAIEAAAGKLHAGKPSEAVKPQTDVVEKFNQMYRSVAPYPNLVGRAVAAQQALVEASSPPAESPDEGAAKKAAAAEKPAAAEPEERNRKRARRQSPHLPPLPKEKESKLPAPVPLGREASKEAAWNQEFVTRYSEILAPLAKEGLKQLESTPASPVPSGTRRPSRAAAALQPTPKNSRNSGTVSSDRMEKAVELGPKVEKLSGEAVQLLRDRKPAEALPKQQEALKLLKEIAEPLPKQDQKQDQDKQNQNQTAIRTSKTRSSRTSPTRNSNPKPDQKEQKQNEQREAAQQQAEAQIRQVQERQAEAAGNGKTVAAVYDQARQRGQGLVNVKRHLLLLSIVVGLSRLRSAPPRNRKSRRAWARTKSTRGNRSSIASSSITWRTRRRPNSAAWRTSTSLSSASSRSIRTRSRSSTA